MKRRSIGVGLLAVSIAYSLIDLGGWLRPALLRGRMHGGIERTLALVLGSLSLKAILLVTGAVLAFWPMRPEDDR